MVATRGMGVRAMDDSIIVQQPAHFEHSDRDLHTIPLLQGHPTSNDTT